MSKPTSYREQSSCRNCAHSFCLQEYDRGAVYYCTFGAGPRPPCGSVYMGENALTAGPTKETFEERAARSWQEHLDFEAWADGREVREGGVCDSYAPRSVPGGRTKGKR